jgi:hypothetical protein
MCFVYVYLIRGEMDKAFEWIKKSAEERDSFLPWFRVSPMECWDIPDDPRIDKFLNELGLP